MEKIPEEIIDNLRKTILNKRISVTNSGHFYEGICTYFGYNNFIPSWGLQITIDRLPITNIKLSEIKLVNEI